MQFKNVKYILCGLIIIMIPILTIMFLNFKKNESKLQDGIYKVQQNDLYPNAYIEVKEGRIQFFNVNLDSLYKETLAAYCIRMQESKYGSITEEEKQGIKNSIQLNLCLCENSYILNYDKMMDYGNYEYSNEFFRLKNNIPFGYLYNAKNKTISIGTETENELIFLKK